MISTKTVFTSLFVAMMAMMMSVMAADAFVVQPNRAGSAAQHA
eukprot:CAMPEP_0119548986 /NCGR_PEP_ID=MMETSP1352-20130426/2784_1 /TAXON_ID=265584 /ORGANISM="Stauroneis constricta, Strain CCMP1120" /LENGTH=42 /DNA_ID= /DNA_START= /DNA_END= /DNA_ORIENTATION=